MKAPPLSRRVRSIVVGTAVAGLSIGMRAAVAADAPTTQATTRPMMVQNGATTRPTMVRQQLTDEQKKAAQEASSRYMAAFSDWNKGAKDVSSSLASPKKEELCTRLRGDKEKMVAARKQFDEITQTVRPATPDRGDATDASAGIEFDPTLIALGDPTATDAAKALQGSDDPQKAAVGKMRMLLADWVTAKDGDAQQKQVDQFVPLLKQGDVKNHFFNQSAVTLLQVDAKSTDAEYAMQDAVFKNYPSDTVVRMQKMVMASREREAAMKAFENKPMTIEGTTLEGKAFSTNDWKGKVVLVDFWATWCGPCKATLPTVKAAYKKYHDQGFEIVSISNDYTKDALTKFLAADPEMSWTELFDEDAAKEHTWSPISKKMSITAIPQMFLIDRNGVCRTASARENMEEMIPKLLSETATASAN